MAQARKASKINSKINMLIYGAPFTGKSTLGMQLSMLHTKDGRPFRLLVLDGEQGGVDDMLESLESEGVNLDNILIIYTQSLNEVLDYVRKASGKQNFYELDENGEETETVILDADGNPFHPDAILLDGSSILRLTSEHSLLELAQRRAKFKANKNGLVGEEKKLAVEDVVLSPREWGSLNRKGQELVLDLAASGLHWVITAREKPEKKTVVINGKEVQVDTGNFLFDSFKNIDYNTKTNVRLFRDDDEPNIVKMYVQKDRTHTYPEFETIDDPTLLAFQSLIDKSVGEDVVVKNSMVQSIENDIGLYEKSLGLDAQEETNSSAETAAVANNETPATESAALEIVDKITKLNRTMTTAQKAEFGNRLRAEKLPTSGLKKVTDTDVLNRILVICTEISEAGV